jgi:hypothetical protein
MAELTDAQIDAALARGARTQQEEPRALSALYAPADRRVTVSLTNGASFAFPVDMITELQGASAAQLSDVAVLGRGYGLRWEALDVDLTVPGLLADIFGTRSHMARRAGSATSEAKAAAARANGARGGRPRAAKTA